MIEAVRGEHLLARPISDRPTVAILRLPEVADDEGNTTRSGLANPQPSGLAGQFLGQVHQLAESAPRLCIGARRRQRGSQNAFCLFDKIRFLSDLRVLIELHLGETLEAPMGLREAEVLALLRELGQPRFGSKEAVEHRPESRKSRRARRRGLVAKRPPLSICPGVA